MPQHHAYNRHRQALEAPQVHDGVIGVGSPIAISLFCETLPPRYAYQAYAAIYNWKYPPQQVPAPRLDDIALNQSKMSLLSLISKNWEFAHHSKTFQQNIDMIDQHIRREIKKGDFEPQFMANHAWYVNTVANFKMAMEQGQKPNYWFFEQLAVLKMVTSPWQCAPLALCNGAHSFIHQYQLPIQVPSNIEFAHNMEYVIKEISKGEIKREELEPGDTIIYYGAPNHIATYVGFFNGEHMAISKLALDPVFYHPVDLMYSEWGEPRFFKGDKQRINPQIWEQIMRPIVKYTDYFVPRRQSRPE
jgi:hypothetical protein